MNEGRSSFADIAFGQYVSGPGHHTLEVSPAAHAMQLYLLSSLLVSENRVLFNREKALVISARLNQPAPQRGPIESMFLPWHQDPRWQSRGQD